ncbi:MAG: AraC family transcriptional regulator [bacterium]|nr:AraC family transcriptional regulator [bacterium]
MKQWHSLLALIRCTLECQAALLHGREEFVSWLSEHTIFDNENMELYHSFFQEAYKSVNVDDVFCLKNPFQIYTCVLAIGQDDFLMLGPYLVEKPDESFLRKVCEKQQLPVSLTMPLKGFYDSIPVQTHMKMNAVAQILRRQAGFSAAAGFYIFDFDVLSHTPENWMQISEGLISEYTEALELRYRNDLELCSKLMQGDLDACVRFQAKKDSTFIRINPKENDFFNQLIYHYTFNILYRILSYAAGVPAPYIQDLQNKWNRKINELMHSSAARFTGKEMMVSYCRLIQRKAFLGHSPYIKKTLSYLDVRLSTHLTLEEIADAMGLSTGHLSRMFKKEMGESLMEYINHQRIIASLPFIRNPRIRIQEVGSYVGIEDSNYFARVFKKYMGLSPSQYRKKNEGFLG